MALVALIVVLAPGRFTGEAQLQEPTAIIDPALTEALQTQAELEVLISLKQPDIPATERTTEVKRQNTADRQGPGALGVDPFRLESDPSV